VKKYNATVSEDMQLPVLSLHCLRHTNASLLVRSNRVDIVSVSKKLGHADPNVAAKYYLHSYEEGEQETADILGDMLLDSGAKVAKFVFLSIRSKGETPKPLRHKEFERMCMGT